MAKHSRLGSAILLVTSIVGGLALMEAGLRLFAPTALATIGRQMTGNARIYGWGYDPGEPIILSDPDTGRVFSDSANSRGWRDADHDFAKPPGRFRILILGDSVTFAPLVPASESYPRLLEERLRAEGYDAEVIALAYGGWGTDQEYEALRREGLNYSPDLVILQFCSNDPADNLYWKDPRFAGLKPVFYQLDAKGRLRRDDNPNFRPAEPSLLRRLFEPILVRSEILKRAYLVWRVKNHGRAQDGQGLRMTFAKLQQLEMVLEVPANAVLTEYLRAHLDQPLDRAELERQIDASGLNAKRDAILRVAENRAITDGWGGTHSLIETEESWRTEIALIDAVRETALTVKAGFALYSDTEEGLRRWEVLWHRITDSAQDRRNFLMAQTLLRDYAARTGSGFIDPVRPVERARNDPHPNAAGNQAMTDSFYAFLTSSYRDQLAAHRLGPAR